MGETFDRVRQFLTQDLWSVDLRPRTLWGVGVRTLQLVVMVGEGFIRDQLLLRASALTYMAMLSIIPLLVVAISIVNALGVSANLAELAVDQITVGSPGAKAEILELVRNADVGALGAVGAALLFFTTVLALRNAEEALNYIWGVARGRSWARRFADYLAVLVVVPLFTGVAISMVPALQSGWVVTYGLQFPVFEFLYRTGLRWMPAFLFFLGFSFVYLFLPNTRVKLTSALLGGATAAVLFILAQRLFVEFTVGSARYSVVFGSFAALPLLVTWLYVSFAIILLGAEISFAHQNLAQYRREVTGSPPGAAEREAVGLRIAVEAARTFRDRGPPCTGDALSDTLDVPIRTIRALLHELTSAGVLCELAHGDTDVAYQPAAPVDSIRVGDVLTALRGPRRDRDQHGTEPARRAVGSLLEELDESVASIAGKRTLADILQQVPPEGATLDATT